MEGGNENSREGETDDVGERSFKDQDLLWGTRVEVTCTAQERRTGHWERSGVHRRPRGEGPVRTETLGES